jgi:hypothetical protein
MGLIESAELKRHLSALDKYQAASIDHPEWFEAPVLPAAQDWLAGEIAQLEAELLAENEDEKRHSHLAGRLNQGKANLITPSIPQWSGTGKRLTVDGR